MINNVVLAARQAKCGPRATARPETRYKRTARGDKLFGPRAVLCYTERQKRQHIVRR